MAAQQTRIDYLSNDIANVNTTGYQSQRLAFTRSRLHARAGRPGRRRLGGRRASARPARAARSSQSDNPLVARDPGPRLLPGQARRRLDRAHPRRHASASTRTATSSPRPASSSTRRSRCRRARSRPTSRSAADGTVSVGRQEARQDHGRRRPLPGGPRAARRQPLRARRAASGSRRSPIDDDDRAGRARVLERRPRRRRCPSMIDAQRSYELASRAIKTQDELLDVANQIVK